MQQSGGPEENEVHFRFFFEHNRLVHRLVIDYASQRISNNFFLNLFRVKRFTFMFLDDKNSEI